MIYKPLIQHISKHQETGSMLPRNDVSIWADELQTDPPELKASLEALGEAGILVRFDVALRQGPWHSSYRLTDYGKTLLRSESHPAME